MTSLKGSILITGANGGLGSATVSNFIKSPEGEEYYGIYSVRDPASFKTLSNILKTAPTSHKYEILELDLSSLESVREAAASINRRVASGIIQPLRGVILNAAFQEANNQSLSPHTFTKDGFEANFGINYLANFLFILLILQSIDKEHGRIVIVSSWAHDPYDKYNAMADLFGNHEYLTVMDDLDSLVKGKTYTDDGFKAGMRRYGNSKTLMVMFMYELQRRLDADTGLSNISVLSLDPGAMGGTGIARRGALIIRIATTITAYLGPLIVYFNPNGMIRSSNKSGHDLLYATFDEKTLGIHPKAVYLNGTSTEKQTAEEARDEKKQKLLWAESLKLARVRDGDTVLKGWQ